MHGKRIESTPVCRGSGSVASACHSPDQRLWQGGAIVHRLSQQEGSAGHRRGGYRHVLAVHHPGFVRKPARFHGEPGDLQELLGNLLENAFKWAGHRVLLAVKLRPVAGRQRAGLCMSVEDDGPGIAADQVEKVLQRGVRGDERVQGIGLSIVQDIVHAYHGELVVDRSPEFGGARFTVTLAAS